ncbi:hypothetical protein MBOVa_0610 [Mycoplasmopsis bovis 8790]|nr:hypothetical protein MBOVa_0610 [Mycoplasmopsis bovis 8790]
MKKLNKPIFLFGSLITIGSFPIIAAKCTEGNNGYDSKNDSSQVINPIKDGSQGQNDGNKTSNNDQPIDSSNKSDNAVMNSKPKKETDQPSTNNSSETPNNSLTPPTSKTKSKESHREAASRLTKEYFDLLFNNTNQNHSDSANSSMLRPMDNGNTVPTNQNIRKKEMHDEAASRLTKEYFDLLFDIQNNKDKLYKLSPRDKLDYIYKSLNKNSDIKSKLSTKELISKLNNDLDSVYKLVIYSNANEKEFFKKLGLDDEFNRYFFDFFDLLSSLISINDDQTYKNKAEDLFNKAKSKIDEAHNKEFKKK